MLTASFLTHSHSPKTLEEEEEKVPVKGGSVKPPSKSPLNMSIGSADKGSDNKTKYSVQLNKSGKKFWKKNG